MFLRILHRNDTPNGKSTSVRTISDGPLCGHVTTLANARCARRRVRLILQSDLDSTSILLRAKTRHEILFDCSRNCKRRWQCCNPLGRHAGVALVSSLPDHLPNSTWPTPFGTPWAWAPEAPASPSLGRFFSLVSGSEKNHPYVGVSFLLIKTPFFTIQTGLPPHKLF